jgi:alpha-amylase/alpha-mannosidase (GH57 family)
METAILNKGVVDKPLNVVLCWHMHQPHYRDGIDGEYRLPWVYLHAIKDYTDMAWHLEQTPDMKAVVNFAPVLLEQLDDYAQQMDDFLSAPDDSQMQDDLLNLLSGAKPIPQDVAEREKIIQDCQRCHAPRMIIPYPHFLALFQSIGVDVEHKTSDYNIDLGYLHDQYFLDLLTWYHLSWLGHALKQRDDVQALLQKEKHYTHADRLLLISIMQQAVAGIIPRYRALAERGQVELSMTPYGHPIVPLLNDFDNMKCSLPNAPTPEPESYPGGTERNRWHLEQGFALFDQYFGMKPKGIWLSEGGVSIDALKLLDEYGIEWTASGEGVWRNSCQLSGCDQDMVDSKKGLFTPYRLATVDTRLFFRDDGLSDRIGFEYSHWNAQDAANDFTHHLHNIRHFLNHDGLQDEHVVSIILDGENAWEYYVDNGYPFLEALYQTLSTQADLTITHFAEVAAKTNAFELPNLCAGSWVYGSFSTWIGEHDKNRAWNYLVKVKQAYDEVLATKKLTKAQMDLATHQLAICEGSDWFWWFGEYNPSDSVNDFDQLFRQQLRHLYELLQLTPPEHLDTPLSQGNQGGHSAENAGTMRRN